MMADVVDLNERRPGADHWPCPRCGGVWFTVQAVTLWPDRRVNAYAAPVICVECGYVVLDGAWRSTSLKEVKDDGERERVGGGEGSTDEDAADPGGAG